MSEPGLRIGYVDAAALAHLTADPGAPGHLAAELVEALSVASTSQLSLAEVPHRVGERFPGMVAVARIAWPWVIDELTIVQLETADLEAAGTAGWTVGNPCTSIHLAVAAKIAATDFVTADDDAAARANAAGMAVANVRPQP